MRPQLRQPVLRLTRAIKKGLLAEPDVDQALRHIFTARFGLGMFDPPELVPYSRIPMSAVDSLSPLGCGLFWIGMFADLEVDDFLLTTFILLRHAFRRQIFFRPNLLSLNFAGARGRHRLARRWR